MSRLENSIIIQIPTFVMYYCWGDILLSEREKLFSLLRWDNLYLELCVFFWNCVFFWIYGTFWWYLELSKLYFILCPSYFFSSIYELMSFLFLLFSFCFLSCFLILFYCWKVIAYSNILNKMRSFIFSMIPQSLPSHGIFLNISFT